MKDFASSWKHIIDGIRAENEYRERMMETLDRVVRMDFDKIYKDYADGINKLCDSLTMAEKKQAILNAVLDEGKRE